jgi:hypothetical protein
MTGGLPRRYGACPEVNVERARYRIVYRQRLTRLVGHPESRRPEPIRGWMLLPKARCLRRWRGRPESYRTRLRQQSRMCGLSPRTVHSRPRRRQSASARSVLIRTRSPRGSRPSECSHPANCLWEAEAVVRLPGAVPGTAPKAENRHHSRRVQAGAPKGRCLRRFCFSSVASKLRRRPWVSLLRR